MASQDMCILWFPNCYAGLGGSDARYDAAMIPKC
jgi:hypothetical protein